MIVNARIDNLNSQPECLAQSPCDHVAVVPPCSCRDVKRVARICRRLRPRGWLPVQRYNFISMKPFEYRRPNLQEMSNGPVAETVFCARRVRWVSKPSPIERSPH